MKAFNVWGRISFTINLNIEAENEEDAIIEAKERLTDFYHLDSHGSPHNPNETVDFKIYADNL
jgi:hypothetical protein